MPYVMLVIGALMSVAGLYSVITGYRIVQVEEGWSSVIAGSVLFVGGFLTIGLGLVLRSLRDLRRALPGMGAAAATPLPLEPAPAIAPAPAVPTPIAPPPPRSPAEPVFPSAIQSEPAVKAEQPVPAAPFLAPPPFRPPVAPAAFAFETHEPPRVDAFEPVSTPPTPTYEPPQIPEPESVPPPAEPHPADDYKLTKKDAPAPEFANDEPPPPSAPTDDWLDRAFAEFDQELPKTEQKAPPRLPPAPPMPEPKGFPHPKRPREPEFATAEPEPVHAAVEAEPPAPASAPEPASATSAIIGRYEADGTTYVMFADGSIEAQSPNGVYRFASMAELKSFIES